jgi:hypothetical protein
LKSKVDGLPVQLDLFEEDELPADVELDQLLVRVASDASSDVGLVLPCHVYVI